MNGDAKNMNGDAKTLVAITQPDFFPWLGSVYKLVNVDKFIFLDHVRNRIGDGIWTKRVKILENGTSRWLTVPLRKLDGAEFVPINRMLIAHEIPFKDKHLKSIRNAYGRTQFFSEVMPLVESWYDDPSPYIADRNMSFLRNLLKIWEISVEISLSSQLDCHESASALLVEIVQKVGGTAYLFGAGSAAYLESEVFQEAGIELRPQNYQHPRYPQPNSSTFFEGLSIIDALMNSGLAYTKALLGPVGT